MSELSNQLWIIDHRWGWEYLAFLTGLFLFIVNIKFCKIVINKKLDIVNLQAVRIIL